MATDHELRLRERLTRLRNLNLLGGARVSGELDKASFEPAFASFASGPAVNEALRAGDVDVGTMGDVPALGRQ